VYDLADHVTQKIACFMLYTDQIMKELRVLRASRPALRDNWLRLQSSIKPISKPWMT